MNLLQCVNAYTAVQTMMSQQMDYQTAYALVNLKRKLAPHASFYQNKELELVEEFAARDEEGKILWRDNGRFVFKDKEGAQEFERRRKELDLVQVQEQFSLQRVPEPGIIRPVILEALEGFVEFFDRKVDEHG